jgi:hypothetical protein
MAGHTDVSIAVARLCRIGELRNLPGLTHLGGEVESAVAIHL